MLNFMDSFLCLLKKQLVDGASLKALRTIFLMKPGLLVVFIFLTQLGNLRPLHLDD